MYARHRNGPVGRYYIEHIGGRLLRMPRILYARARAAGARIADLSKSLAPISILILGVMLLLASGCKAPAPVNETAPFPTAVTATIRDPLEVTGLAVVAWAINDRQSPPPVTRVFSRPAAGPATQSIAELLAPFAGAQLPLPARVKAAWEKSGFGLFIVPSAEVERLQARLRLAGPVQRQFFPITPTWSQAFRGPYAAGNQTIMFDDGPSDITTGAFRLLMRCYAAPKADADSTLDTVLRLDLVPQHIDQRSQSMGSGPTEQTSPSDNPSVGTVFTRLLCEIALEPDQSLIIISLGSGSLIPGSPQPASTFGPDIPAPYSLADGLLSDVLAGGQGRVNIVLAFVPAVQKQRAR